MVCTSGKHKKDRKEFLKGDKSSTCCICKQEFTSTPIRRKTAGHMKSQNGWAYLCAICHSCNTSAPRCSVNGWNTPRWVSIGNRKKKLLGRSNE